MPTPAQWVAGARPRTLPISIAPVIAGSATAHAAGGFMIIPAVLALLVSISLQIGVNFANDYSDGIRGTDEQRVGPMRLVGSGVARPVLVKRAAFGCFGLAALLGLVLMILSAQWWLLPVGVACILAAWYYTGGKHPYGYIGLGEIFVFVFFGLVAVAGTTLVQLGRIDLPTILVAIGIGLLADAVLVSNNLRDIGGDTLSGKRTLATRIGDKATRRLFAGLALGAAVAFVIAAALTSWWALLALIGIGYLAPQVVTVLRGAVGPGLIPTLKAAGLADLFSAIGLAAGLVIAGLI
ncbi:1,4-dihydroxy-2-naphthoate polyprenyltransferase [Microlunatus elymi]|uniref:1,4-dihydroxy-2-naphthoate octaprenyltransferase n=1 Tax=Microlunatus elymi TaxID=2596828 RepID=A0A516Q6H1_9ACTN|nr:1,4-dihydroxy-2-naphthoate polyprenyltransferase [Microlunatus elymi]QDP99039.1 1,4-dihydroxy-2-naphthoate polyprenyltransferase [Microlunatus elymi]